jgi:hypothetical protein
VKSQVRTGDIYKHKRKEGQEGPDESIVEEMKRKWEHGKCERRRLKKWKMGFGSSKMEVMSV